MREVRVSGSLEVGGARLETHSSSGKVEGTKLVRPSIRVPNPVGDGVINKRRPDEDEDDCGENGRWQLLGHCSDNGDVDHSCE